MKKYKYLFLKNKQLLLFILVFIFMFMYLCVLDININGLKGGDAFECWKVAAHFFSNNPYHSYVEYRGWLWSGILAVLYQGSIFLNFNEYALFRVFAALEFSYLVTIGLPVIFEHILSKKINLKLRLLFSVVIFYFFNGNFYIPLVDVPPLFFTILSVHLILKNNNIWLLLLSGLMFGCAFLLRANYLVALPVFLWLFFINNSRNYKRAIVVFMCPFLILQYSNNVYLKHNATAIGFTGDYVLKAQLTLGVYQQKYDGYIYVDKMGQDILRREQILNKSAKVYDGGYNWLSISQYIKLYIRYPLEMIGINFRHLFNGIDIMSSTPYARSGGALAKVNGVTAVDIMGDGSYAEYCKALFRILNYILISFSLVTIFINRKIFYNCYSICLSLMIILPAISTIPFRVEPRYLMPLLIFIYACGIFNINSIKNIMINKHEKVKSIILLLSISVSVILCICLHNYIMQFGVPWNIPIVW